MIGAARLSHWPQNRLRGSQSSLARVVCELRLQNALQFWVRGEVRVLQAPISAQDSGRRSARSLGSRAWSFLRPPFPKALVRFRSRQSGFLNICCQRCCPARHLPASRIPRWVAPGLQISPDFAGFCRANLLIFFVFSRAFATLDQHFGVRIHGGQPILHPRLCHSGGNLDDYCCKACTTSCSISAGSVAPTNFLRIVPSRLMTNVTGSPRTPP
jgi:hypothetical protein